MRKKRPVPFSLAQTRIVPGHHRPRRACSRIFQAVNNEIYTPLYIWMIANLLKSNEPVAVAEGS